MTKRTKILVAAVLLALVLSGAGMAIRLFVLYQIRESLEAAVSYARLHLSPFPPTLVLEDVRSISGSPSFSARRITIATSFPALLRQRRSVRISIEHPVVTVIESPAANGKFNLDVVFSLPFTVESGVLEEGEVRYSAGGAGFVATGIRGFFRHSGGALSLKLEAASGSLAVATLPNPLTGKVTLQAEGKPRELKLDKLHIVGRDFDVEASGTLSTGADPDLRLQVDFRAPAALCADIADLPFEWGGRIEASGRLTLSRNEPLFRAGLKSFDAVLNSVPLGRLEGDLTLNRDGSGTAAVTAQMGPRPRESLDISFRRGWVEGRAAGLYLDPVIRYINIPWPVGSPAWGGFTLKDRALEVRAEFRDDPVAPENGRFHFRGPAHLTWDGIRDLTFDSERLESSFGFAAVSGNLELDRRVDVDIKAEVSDVIGARAFTELILRETLSVPEVQGKGRANIKILGDPAFPQVKAEFAAAPGRFDGLDAAAVSGLVEVAKKEVTGLFKVQDPEMRGTIELVARPLFLDARIHAEESSLEKILPWLKIESPLAGRATGDFHVSEAGPNLHVTGDLSSPSLSLLGQELNDVRGKFEWTKETGVFSVSSLQATVFGGRLKGAGGVGLNDRSFDIDVTASEIELASIDPRATGLASLSLRGKGAIDRDSASGKFTLKNLGFGPVGGFEATGDVQLNYQDDKLFANLGGFLDPGHDGFSLSFTYAIPDRAYQATLKGSLSNFGRVLPWKGVVGEIAYLAEIKGRGPSPQVSGVLDIKGPVFPLPGFPQAITDFNGLVLIQNNRASIRSLQAKLGGGDVFGSGEIRFGRTGPEFIDVRLDGKNMVLAPVERVRGLADGTLHLLKDDTRFILSGDFQFKSLLWKREFSERFIFSQNPFSRQKKGSGFFDGLALDIRLRASANAFFDNSLGRVDCRYDLTISGYANSPIILGEIDAVRGEVYFQDRTFRVLRARLRFFNPSAFEPYLDFQGETFLRDYRVTFSLTGLIDQLKPEFSSSPPLPPEDVLALLALGESFKRTYSYDVSSQIGTGSLLSFQLAEGAARQAERLFSLDRFRIDPFVLGATTEMTARLTVGKKISRNVILLYSTNLSGQREEIVRFEWEFSGSFSLVGMRDEDGRFSLDAKVRKRF